MKSRGKTPTRFSNRVRARRTDPNEADSRVLHGGRYSLKVKKDKPPVVEISFRGTLKMTTFQSPTNVFPALGHGGQDNHIVDRRPKDETERIFQKLCEGEVGLKNTQSKGTQKIERGISQTSGSVKKLFSSPLSARKSNMVLMTTATESGFYLNCTHNVGHQEGLIGPNIPQCLKDLFKPNMPISLSKEEAEVAAYVFCKLRDEYEKESIVASPLGYCEGE
ncbi:hypothetical protein SESBI_47804 [Sesbania bispinosa]|nr:hypothetical protein SESBI_47804 [Sesbania bispinosa]